MNLVGLLTWRCKFAYLRVQVNVWKLLMRFGHQIYMETLVVP